MAEENAEGQEKTEDPTEERREEFRKKGDVPQSRELTSVVVLFAVVLFISVLSYQGFLILRRMFVSAFLGIQDHDLIYRQFSKYTGDVWIGLLKIIVPVSAVAMIVATFVTFGQTKFNFSFSRLAPNFKKLGLLSGLKRMASGQAAMELFKGIGKMFAVSLVTFLMLYSERFIVPGLMDVSLPAMSIYWADKSKLLVWSVAALLLVVAACDFLYNYTTLEKKMRMSKQEVKEDYKKREIDPFVKGRMRKMQRDISNRKTLRETESSTVLVTNPTHFAVAIRYELGMRAPIVAAKGIDFLAIRMREVAKTTDIPIVENKALARTLYKVVDVGEQIPESLYQAMSEIIRYVFSLKGIKIPAKGS